MNRRQLSIATATTRHRDLPTPEYLDDAVAAMEWAAAETDADPSHVYVPKGEYTVRGEPAANSGALLRSFERADGWKRAYENDGVVIYEAVGDTDPR